MTRVQWQKEIAADLHRAGLQGVYLIGARANGATTLDVTTDAKPITPGVEALRAAGWVVDQVGDTGAYVYERKAT